MEEENIWLDVEEAIESGPSTESSEEQEFVMEYTLPGVHGCKPTLLFNLLECQDKYEILNELGDGSFGSVFKAKDKKTGVIVAIKKSRVIDRSGSIIGIFREISCLEKLRHVNVVKLIEYFVSEKDFKNRSTDFYVVLECCHVDLYEYLQSLTTGIPEPKIKEWSHQILSGIGFIHDNMILHRDIKSRNVLLTESGVAKIADFGMAKCFDSIETMTQGNNNPTVATLWYRAPELLLGERNYRVGVDMWAVGCVLAELWTQKPILPGGSEDDQIMKITDLCGSITTEVWPDVQKLPWFAKTNLPTGIVSKLKETLEVSVRDPLALDLIARLLSLDPSSRVTASSALRNVYFDPIS